jgi:hypothetical protein
LRFVRKADLWNWTTLSTRGHGCSEARRGIFCGLEIRVKFLNYIFHMLNYYMRRTPLSPDNHFLEFGWVALGGPFALFCWG